MSNTIEITGTGGIIEGNLGTANVNVNLDRSLMFDGTNDFIDCGTDTDHDFTDHFTLACWAKNDNATTTGGDREHLIAKYEGSNGKRIFRLYLHGSTLRFGAGYNSGNSSVEITHSMTGLAEHWNHYAATFDGGVMKLYINGVLVTNTDNSGTLTAIHANNAIELEIGAYQSGSHTWTGQMADVRIYNAVLTDANIQFLASKINTDKSLGAGTTNLKGYWKLNNETASGGGSGTGFVVDESGTVNQGTLTNFSGTYWDYDAYSVDVYDNSTTTDGTFTVTQGKLEGLALTCLDFDGTDDHINTGTALQAQIRTGFSMSMLVKPDDGITGANQAIFGSYKDSNNSLVGYIDSGAGKLSFRIVTDGATKYAVEDSASFVDGANSWKHVVFTATFVDASNATMKLYVDGVERTLNSTNNGLLSGGLDDYTSDSNILIGITSASGGNEWPFGGKIRNVRFNDNVLSNDQVASLYSNSFPVTPTHWWKIDDGGAHASGSATVEDYGTGTDADGTKSGAGWQNGTLNLDGTLTIAANGTLSAPRGNLALSANLDNDGTFTNNNGKLLSDGTTYITGDADPVFYDFESTGGQTRFQINITIQNNLTTSGSASTTYIWLGTTLTMGTATSAATLVHGQSTIWFYAYAGGHLATLQGASSLYPVVVSGSGSFNFGGDGGIAQLSNVDFQRNITTDGATDHIKLTGDCEFDAVTVSSGDEFDLNGQRAEFSGDVTYQGTWDADGLAVFHGGFTKYGTLNNAASGDIMTMSSSGNPTFSYITGYRTFFTNGGVQLGTGGFTNISKAIIGSGTLLTGTRDPTATDFTIATGGAYQAEDNTLTVAGDFTTSGGLLGASCLELDNSSSENESASVSDVTWTGMNDAWTVEMWFKTTTDEDMTLFDLRNDSNNNNRIHISTVASSNEIKILPYDKDGYTSGGALTSSGFDFRDGKWHHVAFTSSGTAKQMYIDGKLNASDSVACDRADNPVCRLAIGKTQQSTGGTFFHGAIDEVRMFSDVRTEAEIRADMFQGGTLANSGNLEARYGFNEGTGAECDNAAPSGGSRDLSVTSTAWAGAGTYTYGTSTLKMTGANKYLYHKDSLSLYSLTIATLNDSNASILKDINGGNSTTLINGNLEVQSGKLTSDASELLQIGKTYGDFYIASGKGGIALAEVHGLYIYQNSQSGTKNFPHASSSDKDLTLKRIFINSSSTFEVISQGNLTVTEELEVGGGNTFNANSHTLTCSWLDVNSGTVDLRNSTYLGSTAGAQNRLDFYHDGTLLTGGTTVTGTASPRTNAYFRPQHDFEIVGDVSNLYLRSDGDLTVIGSVTNCVVEGSGDAIRQWQHTLDTQQLLDADEKGDDDLRLESPALDNALELQTN